jgi:hypothetical protein
MELSGHSRFRQYHREMKRRRFVWLLLVLAPVVSAQAKRSVEELVAFVRSAIRLKQDDRKVADEVLKIRLSNRLEARTVEELQHAGAGPKTVAALHKVREASANLPPTVKPAERVEQTAPAIPPPEPAELKAIVAEVRERALDYSKNLPNYICAQVTRRRVDPTGSGEWRLVDTIIEKLTFFEQKEEYKVVMINDRPVTTPLRHEQIGGAKSSGEFGSILRTMFDPETGTEFEWERWATLHGLRTCVLGFRVRQQRYGITHEASKRSILVGFHGLVFADRDTKTVRVIQLKCDDIPPDFPIQSVTLDLVYDTVEIAGQKYVLPQRSDVRSREGRYLAWNQVTYHSYNRFGSDVNITFDTPEDAPPGKKQ